MMKTYIKPNAQVIDLKTEENFLTGSLDTSTEVVVSEPEYSNKYNGWNSINWSDGSED